MSSESVLESQMVFEWDTFSEERLFAPQVGLEPTTHRLTADCSTTELLKKGFFLIYLKKI